MSGRYASAGSYGVIEPRDFFMSLKRILIVDDDEGSRLVLVEMMHFFGYEADGAEGGLEALQAITKQKYDLVITDINMPDLNGLELITRVKASHPEVDLMAVTGYGMEYSYTDVVERGASDFIAKPFDNNELLAKIKRVFRERELLQKLERLSVRDGLTDLYNRRYFDRRIKEEMARANRQKYALFLLLIDIDHFKLYNDTFGHQGGDGLLKDLAYVIDLSIRHDVDTSFRFGGDEFGVIVPQVEREQALKIARRIQDKYGSISGHGNTSLSMGMTRMIQVEGQEPEGADSLIKRADVALFRSKRKGGKTIELYEEG